MRTFSALIAAALIAGCATEEPEQPTYIDEPTDEEPIDVAAIYDIINAQADRISAFEARFDAAEVVDAQQTFDLDNSELWLDALTADIVALQAHAAAQDPILVNASAGVAELVARMDTHTADTAARDARIDILEDENGDQWMAVVDLKGVFNGLQAGIDAGAAQGAAADAEITGLAGALSQHATQVSAAFEAQNDAFEAQNDAFEAQTEAQSDLAAQIDGDVESLALRVKTLELGEIGFEDIDVDASTRCEVGPEYETVEYVLAVDIEPGQILMRWTEIDEVHLVDPLAVKCGELGQLDYPGMPPAVVAGGNVYVVDPDRNDGRDSDTIWRTIVFM
jgi:hypothetical protein